MIPTFTTQLAQTDVPERLGERPAPKP
jgi:hypothetical protein